MAHKKSQNISIVSGWIQKAEDDLSFAKDAKECLGDAQKIIAFIKAKVKLK